MNLLFPADRVYSSIMKVTLDTKINGVPVIVYIPESIEDLRKLLDKATK